MRASVGEGCHTDPVTSPGSLGSEGVAGDVIADGYFDIAGTWHPTPDHVRAALADVLAPVADARPMWFVHPGEEHRLLDPCELVLEDATSLGTIDELPPDLPLGYHDLAPCDGGPVTRLVVAPVACPSQSKTTSDADMAMSVCGDGRVVGGDDCCRIGAEMLEYVNEGL